jgi:SulP family sulfate permease
MTHTRHDGRKEMLGLGLANLASGLAGGIPATAALARTSLNIKTGATSRVSGALHAVFLAAISFLLLSTFSHIPMAVIAAILVFVAVNMVERKHFAKLYRHQRFGFWLSLAVAAVTFYKDPIAGIVLGTAVALLQFAEKLSHGHYEMKFNDLERGLLHSESGDQEHVTLHDADVLLYSVKGKLAYVNGHAHVQRFRHDLAKYATVVLRLRSVYFIDVDGAEALDAILELAEERGQRICVTSVNPSVDRMLDEISPRYRSLKERGLVFAKSTDALRRFGVHMVRA